jgi:hypothetical protein
MNDESLKRVVLYTDEGTTVARKCGIPAIYLATVVALTM